MRIFYGRVMGGGREETGDVMSPGWWLSLLQEGCPPICKHDPWRATVL